MSRYCSCCGRAKRACLCGWISAVSTAVELIILQHPTEVDRAKGTAKILTLSLENSRHYIGEDFTEHAELNQLLADSRYQHWLLYPAPNAQLLNVDFVQARATQTSKPYRVILLDGTWKKAYRMLQVSANLQALQAVCLPKAIVGGYQIRKAPSANSLSTLEAGYHVLKILDPDASVAPLMHAFEQMIGFYITQLPAGVYQRNYLESES